MLRRSITRLASFLLYGGTRKLAAYEVRLLNHVQSEMELDDRDALVRQLDQLDHLKRLHKGRMVTFYFYQPERLPRIKNVAEEYVFAAYKLESTTGKTTARVVFHLGLLSSIELSKAPGAVLAEDFSIRRKRGAGKSLPEQINAEEHQGSI